MVPSTDSAVLAAHRERVARLSDALERLEALHDEAYQLWDRIVRLAARDDPERYEKLTDLHDAAYSLAEQITHVREETFGNISREASLRLTAQVESVRPGQVSSEPAAPVGD